MQQPELGKRLTALRKEKNMTQEELVEKSHVSVRTIQRIEAGEVLPRMSTVNILIGAMGETYESFMARAPQSAEPQKALIPRSRVNAVLVAAVAGGVYLVSEVILGMMDIAWINGTDRWGSTVDAFYISLSVVTVNAYALFARGFIVLSQVFDNTLLKVMAYVLIAAVACMGIMDITSLHVEDVESLLLRYAAASIILGAMSILFGVALIRLQDGMGNLARIAGLLEIAMGCMFITVVLFFVVYVVMIPATVVEILLLYRAYEYLSRSESALANL
jgi:transcriptional regulator with XRE-family HTH domain